jgi:hypothetical protein
VNRRTVITTGALAAMGSRASEAADPATKSPVVRVSYGRYPVEKEAAIAEIMNYSGKPVEQAIQKLPGLISFYSGIDREAHTIVNASLWKDIESAKQMDTLQAMIDLGKAVVELGVKFERPIANCTTLWSA